MNAMKKVFLTTTLAVLSLPVLAAGAAGKIEGTGTVNSVNAAAHTVNITHDPIKALGWPKMKMEFGVVPEVNLSTVKPGDAVIFTLKEKGEGDYLINTLRTRR